MRRITIFALAITGVGFLALIPAVTEGQFPGGKGKGGFPGGGGGFPGGRGFGNGDQNLDADALYDIYARGRSSISLQDVRSKMNGPLAQYVQEKGLNPEIITRAQFKDFYNSVYKAGAASQGSPGGGFQFMPGGGFAFKKKGGDQPASLDPDTINTLADQEFRKYDKNGDNRLNEEEMPYSLKSNLEKWDKNRDGLIDLYEFRAYYLAKVQGSPDASFQGKRGMDAIVIDEEDLDRKPVVYRVGGKQPPGLPDWFNKLDTDKDGQVALYEWRTAGKALDDFKTWDLNDDGFITAEEASKVQLATAKDNPRNSLASATEGSGGNGGGNGGGFKAFFGGGKSKGGDSGGKGGPGGWGQRSGGDNSNGGGYGKGKKTKTPPGSSSN